MDPFLVKQLVKYAKDIFTTLAMDLRYYLHPHKVKTICYEVLCVGMVGSRRKRGTSLLGDIR